MKATHDLTPWYPKTLDKLTSEIDGVLPCATCIRAEDDEIIVKTGLYVITTKGDLCLEHELEVQTPPKKKQTMPGKHVTPKQQRKDWSEDALNHLKDATYLASSVAQLLRDDERNLLADEWESIGKDLAILRDRMDKLT